MNSTLLRLTALLAALALTSPAFAVSGVAVDAAAVEVVPGLTLAEAMATPNADLDAAAGRHLSRAERRTVKRAKRHTARAAAAPGGKARSFSIAGFICGAASLLLSFGILGVAAAVVGIVLSALALKKMREGEDGIRGLALAGLICGIVGAGLFLLILL